MRTLLFFAVLLQANASAEVTLPAALGAAGKAASVHRENMARRQTADKFKRLCGAKGFQPLSERAGLACAYAKSHADAEIALFLAFEWDWNQRMNQAYSPGYRNPHTQRAVQYEKNAAALRERARGIGAIAVVDGLDSVGLVEGIDYSPGA